MVNFHRTIIPVVVLEHTQAPGFLDREIHQLVYYENIPFE